MFTNSHDRSVEVVASGLADGAVVDSLIYEQLVASAREPARPTRVIDRSPPLGMMPVVVPSGMPREIRARLREVLLSLHRDSGSSAAMLVTRIERFEEPSPGLYEMASTIMEANQ
jgi:phosphonate transport system substrate-binding protein